jgi:hypothetical protein
MPIHGLMMTDAQQTSEGKRFWLDCICAAITRRKAFVYRINLLRKNSFVRIKTLPVYCDWEEVLYGKDPKHEHERVIVSLTELD